MWFGVLGPGRQATFLVAGLSMFAKRVRSLCCSVGYVDLSFLDGVFMSSLHDLRSLCSDSAPLSTAA